MTLQLRPANLGDLITVTCGLEAIEKEQMQALSGNAFDLDRTVQCAMNFPGPKWAIVDAADTATAVAVGGLMPVRPGVMHSWFMARPEAWVKGNNITELVASVVADALKSGVHRVETLCLASRERALRWYEKVGLTHEATLKNYGVKGEDCVLYVALRPPTTGVVH